MLARLLVTQVALVLLSNLALAADRPTVTALEMVETRRARLKPQPEKDAMRMSFDRPVLKLVIEVQGEDAAKASHFGMLELENAADDKGAKLKLDEQGMSFEDIRSEFKEIDRQQMFFGEDDPPKDAIRIEIPFEPPARAASTISLRGKLLLKRVETLDLVVDGTPGDVKDERLEQAGLKVTIVKPDDERTFSFEAKGKIDALHHAQPTDAKGEALGTMGGSTMTGGETLRRDIGLTDPLPAGAKLKLSLVVKSENVPVALDLKDLKLP